jgi:hypothetical protein
MQLEVRKYLFDIEQAAALLLQFVAGKNIDDYLQQPLLQSGVERQFEIIGEAINQLAKLDVNVAQGDGKRRADGPRCRRVKYDGLHAVMQTREIRE